VTFDTHLPLNERLMRIDHIQARRYSKLNGLALEIATEGIIRHLKACDRMDVNPETSAVREIIDDALNGRRVFAETKEQLLGFYVVDCASLEEAIEAARGWTVEGGALEIRPILYFNPGVGLK